ncbi:LemA family protein [Burkholderiaceae bacterium FT117]|uniref:LemA family protein n=1 Tax=Zeimonas sediminis TaxID=2944268 RepID=UPI002342E670|nr:LemA family protein [Zeimonas sediminis]MCM5570985.1 LemA family protein [Zeimonas sediminis]
MSSGPILLVVLLLLPLLWAVAAYNRFVTLRNRCENAFAQIDVQLRRRHDLIPNLVAATRGYLEHERRTLEAVIAARKQVGEASAEARAHPRDPHALEALEHAEAVLAGPLARLMALVEAYPALQGDETVRRLTEELQTTENRIAFARQAYNDQAATYNTGIESFPASLVATLFGFVRTRMLRPAAAPAQREAVAVAL